MDDYDTLATLMRVNEQCNSLVRPKLYTAVNVKFDMEKSYRDSTRPRHCIPASDLTRLPTNSLGALVKYIDCHSSTSLNAISAIMNAFPGAVEKLWKAESRRLGSNLCWIHYTHEALKHLDVGDLWPDNLTLANLPNLEFAMIRSFMLRIDQLQGGALVMVDLQLWSCYFRTCPRPLKGLGIIHGHPDYPTEEGPDLYWLATYQQDDGSYMPLLDVFAKGLPTQEKPIWDERDWGRIGLRLSVFGDLKMPAWGMPELYQNPWDDFSCGGEMPHWMVFGTDDRAWAGELQKLPLQSIWPCTALSMRSVDIDAADVCYLICRARNNLVTLNFEKVNLRQGTWSDIFECALTWSNNLCNIRICESGYVGASDDQVGTDLTNLTDADISDPPVVPEDRRDLNWEVKRPFQGIRRFDALKEDANALRKLREKPRQQVRGSFRNYGVTGMSRLLISKCGTSSVRCRRPGAYTQCRIISA